jgi:S1-C subfamily serine protease
MKSEQSTNRASKDWKTVAMFVLGTGFIFTGGMLLGERLGLPHSNDKTGPAGQTEQNGLVAEGPDAKNSGKSVVNYLPSQIADIAAEVAPSVVTIELLPLKPTDKVKPAFFGLMPGMTNPPTENSEGLAPPPRKSLGTGIIMRPDGYILTSAHVIRPGTSIMIGLNDKRKLSAEVVGRDLFSDLAVLRVKERDLPAAKFGSIKNLRPGDWAIAIGSPLGFDHTVTLGIISAIGRSIDDDIFRNRVDLIQTDAAINFGNSGGPLLNIKGEVIGINTAMRGDAQNISFAIPVDEARKVASQLIEHGEIPRPYLGIYMSDLNPSYAAQLKLPTDLTGVVVTRVVPAGPCDKAGLGAGDVLQKVDGKIVTLPSDVRKLTRVKNPGDEFTVEFWRKGATQTRKVQVGKYPTDIVPH